MRIHPQDTFSKKLHQLRKSTVQDNQLTGPSCYINTGFPCDKKNLLTDLQEFWDYRDTLSIENGLITCGNRIIVPKDMRAEMLQYIHKGHQGKERCLLWARNTVFWPKITYDIQKLIAKNMENPNPSFEPLKNCHHFHGTHWQQISSTGREWTFS